MTSDCAAKIFILNLPKNKQQLNNRARQLTCMYDIQTQMYKIYKFF